MKKYQPQILHDYWERSIVEKDEGQLQHQFAFLRTKSGVGSWTTNM